MLWCLEVIIAEQNRSTSSYETCIILYQDVWIRLFLSVSQWMYYYVWLYHSVLLPTVL